MHVQDPSELVIEYHRRAFGVLHLFKSKKRQNQKTEESYGYSVFLVPAMTFIYLGTSLDASVYDMQILIPSLSS